VFLGGHALLEICFLLVTNATIEISIEWQAAKRHPSWFAQADECGLDQEDTSCLVLTISASFGGTRTHFSHKSIAFVGIIRLLNSHQVTKLSAALRELGTLAFCVLPDSHTWSAIRPPTSLHLVALDSPKIKQI